MRVMRRLIGTAALPAWLQPPARRSADDRPPIPSREEFLAARARLGSVHALAKHYRRDRRQIYRWLELHGVSES